MAVPSSPFADQQVYDPDQSRNAVSLPSPRMAEPAPGWVRRVRRDAVALLLDPAGAPSFPVALGREDTAAVFEDLIDVVVRTGCAPSDAYLSTAVPRAVFLSWWRRGSAVLTVLADDASAVLEPEDVPYVALVSALERAAGLAAAQALAVTAAHMRKGSLSAAKAILDRHDRAVEDTELRHLEGVGRGPAGGVNVLSDESLRLLFGAAGYFPKPVLDVDSFEAGAPGELGTATVELDAVVS